ncbi:smc4, partial [Symbiodinium microadriaticum]
LAGGLIDASGTMSGGGGKVASGGMRASVSKYSQEEVKKFVQAYEEANAQLMQLRQEREALDEALNSTDREIPELELRERTCTMDVNALKKQSEAYEGRLKSLKVPQLTGEEKAKIKQLEKLIESRSDELNTIMQQHQVVEEEVRDLHNQIMNIGGDELKQAKAKLEEATKKCEDMRHKCKKALLDADNMVKNSKKAEGNAKAAADEFKAEEKKLKKLKEEHSKLDDKAEVVLNEYNKMKESMTAKDAVLEKLKDQRDEVIKKASDFKSQEVDFVNELEEKTRTLRELHSRMSACKGRMEEARKDYAQLPLDFLKELREAAGSAGKLEELARKAVAEELTEKELGKVPRDEVEDRIATLEANIKNLKPNLGAIEDFRRADGEHRARLGDYEQVHNAREDARRTLERLRQQRMKEFMEGFSVISMKLKEMYQMITLGGDAELELVDTLDPFNEGIHFSVRPPKKSWKQITNLSGGEKTLASLSLVFALHHYRPTPLYFMDEIDAALDFRNVSIIANYIKERTKNAQFIVISLRNHMFELADLLVGIYKTLDVSKSIAINPSGFDVSRGTESTQEPAAGGKRPLPLQGPPGNAKRRAK